MIEKILLIIVPTEKNRSIEVHNEVKVGYECGYVVTVGKRCGHRR